MGILDDFIDDPIGEIARRATAPIRDGAEVLHGLSEGELREKAAIRFGVDAIAGLGISEIIELLSEVNQ